MRILGLTIAAIMIASLPSRAQDEVRFVTIGLNAPGRLLITTADGRRLGEDPATGKQFSEIEGARQTTARNREPVFRIPVSASDSRLSLVVGPRNAASEPDLGITGPGFTVRLVGLRLFGNQQYRIEFDASGPSVSVRAAAAFPPELRFAVDPTDGAPSCILSVRRGRLAAGRTVSLSFVPAGNLFELSDDALSRTSYAFEMTTIGDDGSEKIFRESDLKTAGRSLFRIEFAGPRNEQVPCIRKTSKGAGFGGAGCRPMSLSR